MFDILVRYPPGGLYFCLFLYICASALVMLQNLRPWETPRRIRWAVAFSFIFATSAAWLVTRDTGPVLVAFLISSVAGLVTWRWFKNYHASGGLYLLAYILTALFGCVSLTAFLATISISPLTLVLMCIVFPLIPLDILTSMADTLITEAVLCRKKWYRPREPLNPELRDRYPKISVHVPCYDEPPDMVIETLNTIAKLRYPNFEVLVIDNNTKDLTHWRPLEEHCRRLGKRFQFFHVDPLSGAKAGALNFALRHTASDAEIISLIDSDFQVEPDFLETLVGYFDNPTVGFVQSPHDYRLCEKGQFLKLSYWSDRPTYFSEFPALNEYNAMSCVGTMALIRKAALEKVGGWSEWCLTEDWELGVQLHSIGYSSVYVAHTFGRGLVPETFLDLKKQWFRWDYGPVQIFQRHWRLLLPKPFGRPSLLTRAQKFLMLVALIRSFLRAASWLFILIASAVCVSIIWHGERIVVHPVAWWFIAIHVAVTSIVHWLPYRKAGYKARHMLYKHVAFLALSHARQLAVFIGWFTHRKPSFQRTNKFSCSPSALRALNSARAEILMGLAMAAFGVFLAAHASYSPPDLIFFWAAYTILMVPGCFTGPVAALIAEWELLSRARSAQEIMPPVQIQTQC